MAKNKGGFYTPSQVDEKTVGREKLSDGGEAVSTYNKHTGKTVITVKRGFKESAWERENRIKNARRSNIMDSSSPRGGRRGDRQNAIKDSIHG